MQIKIQNKQDLIRLDENLFYEISSIILKEEKKGLNFEISFLLVDNEEMKSLNFRFRGLNKPTDVLAFPMFEEGEEPLPGLDFLLGDIVISTEEAANQAAIAGHTPLKEIVILLIHGLLHLLGYDHTGPLEEEEMKKKESFYLEKVSHNF